MNLGQSLGETFDLLSAGGNVHLSTKWAEILRLDDNTPDFYIALTVIFQKFDEFRQQVEEAEISPRAKSLYTNAAANLSQYANPRSVASLSTQQLSASKSDIDFRRWLGKWKIRWPKAYLQVVGFEKRFDECHIDAFQIGEADIFSDPQAFHLVKHR